MKKSIHLIGLLVLFSNVLVGCSLISPSQENGEPVQAAELTPASWTALGKPGPSHRLWEIFSGNWSTHTTVFQAGVAEPKRSVGRSKISWVLGNRYIKEEFQGEMLNIPFQGIGLMGYDNGARRYTSVWADSLSTAIISSKGRYFAEQNRFEFEGEVYDPLQSKSRNVRTTIDIVTSTEYVVTTYEPSPNGGEAKSLEIRYEKLG